MFTCNYFVCMILPTKNGGPKSKHDISSLLQYFCLPGILITANSSSIEIFAYLDYHGITNRPTIPLHCSAGLRWVLLMLQHRPIHEIGPRGDRDGSGRHFFSRSLLSSCLDSREENIGPILSSSIRHNFVFIRPSGSLCPCTMRCHVLSPDWPRV